MRTRELGIRQASLAAQGLAPGGQCCPPGGVKASRRATTLPAGYGIARESLVPRQHYAVRMHLDFFSFGDACVRACVRARMRAYVRTLAFTAVRVRSCVRACVLLLSNGEQD